MNKQEHDSSAHRGHGEADRFCCEACFLSALPQGIVLRRGAGGEAGTQFDPQAVEAFSAEEKALREMVAMKCGMAPGDAAERFAGR
ncbi:MAG: hypothetical protein ACYCZQ_15440 [Burkholderiales bacterium]